MSDCCLWFFRWSAAAMFTVVPSLAPLSVQCAEAQATSGFLTGFAWHGKRAKQSYILLTHAAYAPDPGKPGGVASFGIPDGGSVMLLAHASYVPSLTPAGARRQVMTTTPPLDAKQLPRFIMVCVWPLDGDKPGKLVTGYAERDDANMSVIPEKYHVGLTVQWNTIPANRAPAQFAQRDFCGEIAKTGKSSAPLWLLDRTDHLEQLTNRASMPSSLVALALKVASISRKYSRQVSWA